MNKNSLNVAIIGAARRKQGTGPFIAAMLQQLGHRICGFIGTTPASIAQTEDELHQRLGISCRGYTSLDHLMSDDIVDVVVICSPTALHHDYIYQALQHGCHVLVEKPWLWVNDRTEYEAITCDLIQTALDRNRLLHMIAQWPYTLPYFHKLYPDQRHHGGLIETFRMHLSPANTGYPAMMLDCVSHLLSMLYSLLGFGSIQQARLLTSRSATNALRMQFDYVHVDGLTRIEFDLQQSQAAVKPAGYAINEQSVNREVILPEYTMQLHGNLKKCEVADPMLLCIEDFLSSVWARLQTDEPLLQHHATHTRQLMQLVDKQ